MQVWNEQSEWRLRGSRGGPDPPKTTPTNADTNTNTNTETRAQKHIYRSTHENTDTKNKQRDARTKVEACARTYKYNNKTPLRIQIHPTRAKSKYARKYKPRWTFGPKTRCFFFCARTCLCKYNKVGITRHDDVRAFPTGAECSHLTHFRGVPKKVDPNARDAELRVISDRRYGTRQWQCT